MTQKQLVILFAASVALYFLYSWYAGSKSNAGVSTSSASTVAGTPAQPIFVDSDGDDL